jgi:hypothetical protein
MGLPWYFLCQFKYDALTRDIELGHPQEALPREIRSLVHMSAASVVPQRI